MHKRRGSICKLYHARARPDAAGADCLRRGLPSVSRCSTDESDNDPFYDGEGSLTKLTSPLEANKSLGGSICAGC